MPRIVSLEVVDLRSIVPFDDETVAASVRRTGRCVVVQEAQGFAGVGAEIAARVQEHRDAGADHVCVQLLAAPGAPVDRAAWRAIAPALVDQR